MPKSGGIAILLLKALVFSRRFLLSLILLSPCISTAESGHPLSETLTFNPKTGRIMQLSEAGKPASALALNTSPLTSISHQLPSVAVRNGRKSAIHGGFPPRSTAAATHAVSAFVSLQTARYARCLRGHPWPQSWISHLCGEISRLTAQQAQNSALDFLSKNKLKIGITSNADFIPRRVRTDSLGISHVDLDLYRNGIRVFGSGASVHLGFEKFAMLQAHEPDPLISSNPEISEARAIEIALALWRSRFSPNVNISDVELVFLDRSIFTETKSPDYRLAYAIEAGEPLPSTRLQAVLFIDAHTGGLIHALSQVSHARHVFDCSYADQYDGNCYSGITLPNGVTIGRQEGGAPAGANPIFGTSDTDNLYDSLQNVSEYLSLRHGRNGANGVGGIADGASYPLSHVWAFNYIDRLPGQQCPNAYYNGATLNFCNNLASQIEIVAHEYGHALTRHTADLIYFSEPGALNESFSDIFGNAVDVFSTSSSDRWTVGDGLGLQGFVRSLAQPESFTSPSGKPYPDRFHSSNFYCGSGDSGGVHINSSVLNKAAYLIAQGGNFNGCSIAGIGREKMEQVAMRALTYYLQPTAGFNQAYNAFIAAAIDLFGNPSPELDSIIAALRAVELNQPGRCSGSAPNQPRCESLGGPVDQCPLDPLKTSPGLCGCGQAEEDLNQNGIVDCRDAVATRAVEVAEIAIKGRKLPAHGGKISIVALFRNYDLIREANVVLIDKRSGYRQAFPLFMLKTQSDAAVFGTALRIRRKAGATSAAISIRLMVEVHLTDGRYGWKNAGKVVIRGVK